MPSNQLLCYPRITKLKKEGSFLYWITYQSLYLRKMDGFLSISFCLHLTFRMAQSQEDHAGRIWSMAQCLSAKALNSFQVSFPPFPLDFSSKMEVYQQSYRTPKHPKQSNNYEAKPIRLKTIPFLLQHLRGNVLRSSTHAESCNIKVIGKHLRYSKISHLNMTIGPNEHILWLQVTIHYVLFVKVLNCQKYFRCVKPCLILCEFAPASHYVKEFALFYIVDKHKYLGRTVEGEVKPYQKWMIEILQDQSL